MSTVPFLLTGVTGGIGGKFLSQMMSKLNVPASSIVVTARSESARDRFEAQGLGFRILDYDRPETIRTALVGVDQFFFVSAAEFDNSKRRVMHQNVVDAAKAAGVKKTWYVSLAFGGFEVNDVVSVQAVHNWTEEMLIESGIDFVSLRAGVYADAFPLFINWYPQSTAIHLPNLDPPVKQAHLALTSREELGEGMANLVVNGFKAYPSIKPYGDRRIVLLTASQSVTFVDIAETINKARSTNIPIEYLDAEQWVQDAVANDLGGKPEAWFKARLIWFREMSKGALQTIDPALETLLGRPPISGVEQVQQLIATDFDYTWHQNTAAGAKNAK